MSDVLEGRNPVLEALKSGREINKILVASGANEGSIKQILAMAKDQGIIVQKVERSKLDGLSESDNHQGVIAYVAAYDYSDLDEVLAKVEAEGREPFIVICDEINDPHNFIAVAVAIGFINFPLFLFHFAKQNGLCFFRQILCHLLFGSA